MKHKRNWTHFILTGEKVQKLGVGRDHHTRNTVSPLEKKTQKLEKTSPKLQHILIDKLTNQKM